MKPCKIWPGRTNERGYRRVNINGVPTYTHRVVYENAYGPIPLGYHVHHKCGNKSCVEKEHLELLKQEEHNGKDKREKTHCPHGHEYTPENTRWYKNSRQCKTCQAIWAADYRYKKGNLR